MFLPLRDDVEKHHVPIAGPVLVGANLLVFFHTMQLAVLEKSSGPLLAFFDRWATVPAKVAQGDLTGLVTGLFLHGGLIHIGGNLIVLWAFIHTIEAAMGTLCTIGFFLLWGVAGSLAHVAMHWGEARGLIGASGAVAGVIGAYCVAFGPMTHIRTLLWIGWLFWLDIPASLFAGGWFLMQLWGLAEEGGQACTGIAWYAHLGGFAAGACTMLLIRNHLDHRLIRDRHGTLRFEEVRELPEAIGTEAIGAEAAVVVEHPTDSAYAPPPDTCPHCGQVLGEDQRLADNLMRCANPACERMIYLDPIDHEPQQAAVKG